MAGSFRKIVLVIIDGLRPDAITPEGMPTLTSLMERGWRARSATTVRPSVTVAALTSLASGVAPTCHGLTEARLPSFTRFRGLRPLPGELRRLGVETTVIVPSLSPTTRWIAGALLRLGGITRLRTAPAAPVRLVNAALSHLAGNAEPEFVVVYLNDADLAGHAFGWMSPAYLQAAGSIDQALEPLAALSEDPETLLILTADHGGGGIDPSDHDAPHPLNDGIPMVLVSGRIAPGLVGEDPVHLLDIPPTVLHGFGGTAPGQYAGRVIHEAFTTEYAWVES